MYTVPSLTVLAAAGEGVCREGPPASHHQSRRCAGGTRAGPRQRPARSHDGFTMHARQLRIDAAWFRVWVTRHEGAPPSAWDDMPPAVVAIAPLDSALYTREQALALVEGFNRAQLARAAVADEAAQARRWAVAVGVGLVCLGDWTTGETHHPHAPRRARAPSAAWRVHHRERRR